MKPGRLEPCQWPCKNTDPEPWKSTSHLIVRPLNPWFHSLDSTNLGSCGPGAFLLKKSLSKWTPWFTPMLFKGQLYYYSFCLGSRIKWTETRKVVLALDSTRPSSQSGFSMWTRPRLECEGSVDMALGHAALAHGLSWAEGGWESAGAEDSFPRASLLWLKAELLNMRHHRFLLWIGRWADREEDKVGTEMHPHKQDLLQWLILSVFPPVFTCLQCPAPGSPPHFPPLMALC